MGVLIALNLHIIMNMQNQIPKRYCRTCGCEIPLGRLKIYPDATHCTQHSTTEKVSGFMSWEHKTTPTLNITDAKTADDVAKKTKRNGQSPIRGMRMNGH